MTFRKFATATAFTALLAAPAMGQMYDGFDSTAGYDGFNTGMNDAGYFNAWDGDSDGMLSEREFQTGMYADWDTDNDVQISNDEYTMGAEPWYGADHDGDFDTIDEDGSGYLNQSEWSTGWNTDGYTTWDSDSDGLLNNDEFNTGVYDTADLDDDQYISVEEEGWFEGWFDGDDIEAEIKQVGDGW